MTRIFMFPIRLSHASSISGLGWPAKGLLVKLTNRFCLYAIVRSWMLALKVPPHQGQLCFRRRLDREIGLGNNVLPLLYIVGGKFFRNRITVIMV